MRTTVSSLARNYACLRAQIELMPAAEAYVEEWKRAMDKREVLPAYEEYFRNAAYAARVPILEEGPFAAYLVQCAEDYRLPDPARIVQAIVHAHAEMHLIVDKRCTCPARQLLLSSVQEEGSEDREQGYDDDGEDEDDEEDDEEDDMEDDEEDDVEDDVEDDMEDDEEGGRLDA